MEVAWAIGGLVLLFLLIWGSARMLRVRQESDDRRYGGGDSSGPVDGWGTP